MAEHLQLVAPELELSQQAAGDQRLEIIQGSGGEAWKVGWQEAGSCLAGALIAGQRFDPGFLAEHAGPPEELLALALEEQAAKDSATRGAQIGVVCLLVLGLALLGWQIVRTVGSGGSDENTQTAVPLRTIAIADVIDFDPPPGDGSENADQAPLAVDGKPDTVWHTNRYRTSNFNKSKPGVGLVLDLGHAQVVRQVKLILPAPGESLEIRAAAAGATIAPGDLDSYQLVSSAENVPTQDTLRFPFATNTRFLLVWITKLPRDAGGYRGGISEITVSG